LERRAAAASGNLYLGFAKGPLDWKINFLPCKRFGEVDVFGCSLLSDVVVIALVNLNVVGPASSRPSVRLQSCTGLFSTSPWASRGPYRFEQENGSGIWSLSLSLELDELSG